jgi:hypothetical protein
MELNSDAFPLAAVKNVVAMRSGRIEIRIVGRREIAVGQLGGTEFVEASLRLLFSPDDGRPVMRAELFMM